MGWSFRRRIKVIPGVYLNVSKRGVSTTVGVRGASLTFRGDGTYANVGIPGTGLSSRQKISGRTSAPLPSSRFSSPRPQRSVPLIPEEIEHNADYHFVSADPLEIASPNLDGLQFAVIEANRQKYDLKEDLKLLCNSVKTTRFFINLSKFSLLYFFLPSLRKYLDLLLSKKESAVEEVKSSIASSSVPLGIDMDDDIEDAYEQLLSAFEDLTSSQYIWDVTSASDVDKIKLRSVASSAITRTRTRFSFAHVPGIDSDSPAFHLVNANGADIYIYPGFFVMFENPERLGIVELSKLRVLFERTGFLEQENMPQDSRRISEVWERANKDGSRDKRFSDNRLLPVMEYGEITFKSKTGIYEKYMISNCQYADNFVNALNRFISLLPV
jgi:hypothetical protein